MLTLALLTMFARPRLELRTAVAAGEVRVSLRNAGRAPVVVWAPGSSWHEGSFRFEVRVGRRWEPARRTPTQWLQNSPVLRALKPGESSEFQVPLRDLELPAGAEALRARYLPAPFPPDRPSGALRPGTVEAVSKPSPLSPPGERGRG